MRANEALTLEACLLALSRYDDSLPSDLHNQIQSAGRRLGEDETGAIRQLRELIEQHPSLSVLYESSRSRLQAEYGERERAKSTVGVLPRNGASANGNGHLSRHEVADYILSGPNFGANTRRLVRQPQLQRKAKQSSSDLQTFFKVLTDTATRLHPTKVQLMHKLDGNIFTVGNLAYILELPLESTQRYIKSLWNDGYVRPISGSFLKQIWLSFKGASPLKELPDAETSLKLTAKGYFYLHPGSLSKHRVA
ncbi:MAG: hypothetical protein AAGB19_21775 [Cyanobacteria bacterium P01_F01_bin.3]